MEKTQYCSITLGILFILSTNIYGDLIAYWNFDEGQGSTAQDSIANHDATLSGGVTWATGNSNDPGDFALEFHRGSNDIATVLDSDDLDFGTGPFTALLWTKTQFSSVAAIMSKGARFDAEGRPGWGITYAGSPESLYLLVNNPTSHIEYKTGFHDINDWTQIGVMRDENNKIFYIRNGQLIDTGKIQAGDVSNSVNLTFGREDVYDSSLDGFIDDAALWNTALSSDDIDFINQFGVESFNAIPEPMSMISLLLGISMYLVLKRRPRHFR